VGCTNHDERQTVNDRKQSHHDLNPQEIIQLLFSLLISFEALGTLQYGPLKALVNINFIHMGLSIGPCA